MGHFQIGDAIGGRYVIRRIIGRGGMGMVYEVWDRKHDRRLALKTLLPEYLNHKRAVQRFVQEVNAVRGLDHPCIVKIFDARQADGILFYTMEYIEGRSLRQWMNEKGRCGIGSTTRVLTQLAGALEHAHQFTIHRDISPENVMLTSDGNVKLLDFGLVKLTQSAASFTRVGISLGKIQYSAPEQRADAKNVDHRADIYSLGVMFYEMLSGILPIHGKPLTELVPELPAECDAFVQKALAPDPADRFGSAQEFRLELRRIYELARGRKERVTPITRVAEATYAMQTVAVERRGILGRIIDWLRAVRAANRA